MTFASRKTPRRRPSYLRINKARMNLIERSATKRRVSVAHFDYDGGVARIGIALHVKRLVALPRYGYGASRPRCGMSGIYPADIIAERVNVARTPW